jgi:hypothetical protein
MMERRGFLQRAMGLAAAALFPAARAQHTLARATGRAPLPPPSADGSRVVAILHQPGGYRAVLRRADGKAEVTALVRTGDEHQEWLAARAMDYPEQDEPSL